MPFKEFWGFLLTATETCAMMLCNAMMLASVVMAQNTGSIAGRIDHPMLRRLPGAVYIAQIDGQTFPPPEVHPVMDQQNLQYTPHVLPVLAGSTIDFPNSDETRHHVYTSTSSTCQFELGIYETGIVKQVTCDEPGVTMLLCNVHAEMRGFIISTSTPYFATTAEDGAFRIDDVPSGTYQLVFEHERLGASPLEIVVVSGQETLASFDDLGRKGRSSP